MKREEYCEEDCENEKVCCSSNEVASYDIVYREKLCKDLLNSVKDKYTNNLNLLDTSVISNKLDKFGINLFFVRMYDILDDLYVQYGNRCTKLDYKSIESSMEKLMLECLNFTIETYNICDNKQEDFIQAIKKGMGSI